MNLQFSEQDEAFRREVRAFLDKELTPELRADAYPPHDHAQTQAWHRVLHRRGWSAWHWPKW